MGNTKDSKSEPPPEPNNASTDWREIEYKECSEDWRHRDRLIWATLPVAATVGAVTIGVAYGQIPYCKPELRFWILLIGVVLAFVLLISLIRHRMYQEGSQEQIRSLQVQLNIRSWDRNPRIHPPFYFRLCDITPSKKFDAALTSWTRRSGGFKWILRGTLVVTAVLAGLAIHTLVQWILN
jgi:uncharacterized membrane protein